MELEPIEIIIFAFFAAFIILGIYAFLIRPFTKAGEKDALKDKAIRDDLIKQYGEKMVIAKEEGRLMIGMPKRFVYESYGEPAEIRNSIIAKDKSSEEWYYVPFMYMTRTPMKDAEGKIKYAIQLFFENDVLIKITKPE